MHRLMDNPWLYINCFQSPLFQCIIIESGIFPWWVSRGEVACFKRKWPMSRKGGWKKKGGADIPFHTMIEVCTIYLCWGDILKRPKWKIYHLLSRWFVESQTKISVLTNFTCLIISILHCHVSFWLSFLLCFYLLLWQLQ